MTKVAKERLAQLQENEVIRLRLCVYISLLLRLFRYLNKVKMRFSTITFMRLNDTKTRFLSTLFLPHFINKTTSVAACRCNLPSQTLLPNYQINKFRYNI